MWNRTFAECHPWAVCPTFVHCHDPKKVKCQECTTTEINNTHWLLSGFPSIFHMKKCMALGTTVCKNHTHLFICFTLLKRLPFIQIYIYRHTHCVCMCLHARHLAYYNSVPHRVYMYFKVKRTFYGSFKHKFIETHHHHLVTILMLLIIPPGLLWQGYNWFVK